MAVTPYQEKKYVQSDAVTQAQQALQNQQANKPGAYQSQFQAGIDDLLGQIQNRPEFQYDVNADALYQQVAQNYMQQGQKAMMDTMGQAAALTGGYGNSYAETAGQQAYNNHLLGLTEMVPQFQQMALQQYQMEGDELMDRYALMQQQEETAYGRYQDDLNRYYAELDRLQSAYDNERDYDYGRFSDERDFDYGKYMDDLNYQYQVGRDQVADEQWLQQLHYQQERDRIADEQWQKQYEESIRQFNQNYNLQLEELAAARAAAAAAAARSNYVSSTPAYTPSSTTPSYNQIKSDYIAATRAGVTSSEREAFLKDTVNAGYISQSEANKIAAIYKAPTKNYTAVDQMWDRHS